MLRRFQKRYDGDKKKDNEGEDKQSPTAFLGNSGFDEGIDLLGVAQKIARSMGQNGDVAICFKGFSFILFAS